MRRVTIVIEGGDVGAAFALALATAENLAPLSYASRRDGSVQVVALTTSDDKGGRERWVKRCRREGLTVARAPWEKQR